MTRRILKSPLVFVALCLLFASPVFGVESNQISYPEAGSSIFGEKVMVFDPSMDMDEVQGVLDRLHEQQAHNQFGLERYALLFKPGRYPLTVTVDYYVQASGLGRVPGEVVIDGAVQSIATTRNNNVTVMFWRSAENFEVNPIDPDQPIYWAVSQAAPYRRMHIKGDVMFDMGGWASGGYLANSIVQGTAGTRTGQQWFNRNSEVGAWSGGNWNVTFVGVSGTPAENWPEDPYTVVDATPVIREKPFLTIDERGNYAVFVPEQRHDTVGVSWKDGPEQGELVPMDEFYIAFPEKDDASSLNEALEAGQHILFTPGIYRLTESLQVSHSDTILFGLGLPTLIPMQGNTAISTDDVGGIQLVGLVLDAGPENSTSLIEIGTKGSTADHTANPTMLYDIFCRIGGSAPGQADACLTINSNHVIADHLWLWRADHGAGAKWEVNRSKYGLVVNGDDVTVYGLFNEHFQEYQTLWNGERGRTYFYQSEIPYDPPSIEEWNDNGKPGYASYKVADHVREHEAWGLGIYSFFRPKDAVAAKVRLENSVECPDRPGIRFHHITNFSSRSGGINHVINGMGEPLEVGQTRFFEGFQGE